MTTAALAFLIATALAAPLWIVVTRRTRDRASVEATRRLGLIAATGLLVLAGTTAVLAAAAGPITGLPASAAPVVAALAAITGGGPVVRAVLVAGGVGTAGQPGPAPAPDSADGPAPESDSPSPDSTSPDDPGSDDPNGPGTERPGDNGDAGPLRGGRVIGYLERLAVVTTLMAGWPEGLAIILAVKSLARYPELRAANAAEQFIMGTFASVMWAVGMAGIEHLLTH
ncbi:hypothetical protein [Gordonia sp. 'Campus']|uniref:hypothetical protein n=1 Tax=Gordonia sp. 'Campus' TaxID=2915824 RepID=UPI001EE4111C|nr:hypothetical protein [Gordonia sp. 'Campus']